MISPPISGSPPRAIEESQALTGPASPVAADQSACAHSAEPQPPLLKRRRLRLGEQAGEGLRFNAQLPPGTERMAVLFNLRSLPSASPLSTPHSSPGKNAFRSPSSTLASLLDPPTPVSRHKPSDVWNAARALGKERRHKNEMRLSTPDVVLSPRLVRAMSAQSLRPGLVEKLEALKPGSTDIGQGFTQVSLDRPWGGTPHGPQDMKKIGAGASGNAYAVTLSENFYCDGKDCGRDFVFKAMLCTDPGNPIPRNLYGALSGGASSPEDAIALEKAKIYKEYQVSTSLEGTAQVMRVYGLVQIEDMFGILSEKIEGPTVRQVIGQAHWALNAGAISPEGYLALCKEMVADVLIGACLFADQGVVHQDISHNNVIYDEHQKMFRLIDMGLGEEEGEPSRIGTMGYIDMQSSASHKGDVYSAAQLLAHFLKSPSYAMGFIGISTASSAETFPFMDALESLPSESKVEIIQFFNRMVGRDRDERASAEDLLSDPFFGELPSRDHIHAIYQQLGDRDHWSAQPLPRPAADNAANGLSPADTLSSQRTVSASIASRSSGDSVPAAWRSLSVPSSTL